VVCDRVRRLAEYNDRAAGESSVSGAVPILKFAVCLSVRDARHLARLQIECIRKADRFNPHKHITHIGGRNADGSRMLLTDDDAIGRIKQRTWNFYVHVGRTINVIVARSREGHEYLKTEADGYIPDNLLSRPECL
jgi:hypothetical protein